MVDGGLNGERLSEVSRLAGVLADQVLRDEGMDGGTSLAKLTALGKAALLLQDYDRPIPERVVDVLSRALRGPDDEGPGHAPAFEAVAEHGAGEPGPVDASEEHDGPRRLFPRLIQSLRPARG